MQSRKKIVLSALVASSLVMAEDIDFTQTNKLVTHTEFGYISTEGNTETETYSLDSKVTKGFDNHLFMLSFDGQYASDAEYETKNKYILELEYDYELTSRFAVDYLVGYKDDKFSGFEYQAYTGPGAKYKAIMNDTHNLSLDTNILYSEDSIEDVKHDANGDVIEYPNPDEMVVDTSKTIKGEIDDYIAIRVGFLYDWKITETLNFTQEATYRVDTEDTDVYFAYSKTAFSSKISDFFSAGLSYKVDYINEPAESKEHSDKTLTATLTIDY